MGATLLFERSGRHERTQADGHVHAWIVGSPEPESESPIVAARRQLRSRSIIMTSACSGVGCPWLRRWWSGAAPIRIATAARPEAAEPESAVGPGKAEPVAARGRAEPAVL